MEIVKKCPKHGDLVEDQCFIRIEKRWGNQPKKSFSCFFCKKESSDKYRNRPEIREKLIEKKKKDRIKFKERIYKTRKIYVENNREKINEAEKNRRHRNIDHTRNMQRKQQSKWRESLDDNYVKTQFKRRYNLKASEVPQWMVEVKREIIRLRRKIRELEKK